jgi:hypothetical protein
MLGPLRRDIRTGVIKVRGRPDPPEILIDQKSQDGDSTINNSIFSEHL